jgi:2-polyprenyl-6-methoxyphenol hydroxylase-like FAD-dependent oxidoreductase
VVLDLCLSKASDIAAAFKDYESRRIARTARVVKAARRLGRIGQIENRAGRVVRDFAVRMTPLSATLGAMRWLYDFDI